MTGLTGQGDVRHELHLDGDDACSLARLTSPAFLIEGEVIGLEAHLLREGKACVQLTNCIKGTDVSDGVGAGATADIILVDVLDLTDGTQVSRDTTKLEVVHRLLVQQARDTFVEELAHQGTLPRATDPTDDSECM